LKYTYIPPPRRQKNSFFTTILSTAIFYFIWGGRKLYFQSMRRITIALITAALTVAAPSADTHGKPPADDAVPPDTVTRVNGHSGDSTAKVAAAPDTAAIRAARDSLRALRAAAYGNAASAFNPSACGTPDLFRGDGASAPEILRYRALTSVTIPFSLSSGLNRLLHYGNPAWPRAGYPTTSITATPPFLPYSPRFFGGGLLPGAQTESFAADPQSGLSYTPYPGSPAFPELSVLWENGVFDQNTLNLRLSRPLSPNLTFSAHSQYRFLNGQRFNHERNDVANFYKTFYADTTKIMNNGYNPHVDERFMGAAIMRAGADSSKLYAALSYANLQNEYVLDLPAEALDRLKWAALERDLLRFDASVTDKELRPLRVNAKAALINEELKSSYAADSAIANGKGSALSVIAEADAALPNGAGLAINTMVKRAELFNDSEYVFSEHRAEAFYKREFKRRYAAVNINASAGAALFLGFDTLYTPAYNNGLPVSTKAEASAAHAAPTGRVTVSLTPGPFSNTGGSLSDANGSLSNTGRSLSEVEMTRRRARLSIFAQLSPYAGYPDYAPPYYIVPRFDIPYGGVWAKSSVAAGAEAQAQTRLAGILVGYRNQTNDDLYLLRSLWPSGYPPYRQPRNTVIIAPWTERVAGFSLMSRVIITDTKPFVKASARLSHVTRPAGMEHTFETEIGFDYWSENEPFTLGSCPTDGGYYYGWNDPVFDLNVKVTAHIKTFRLFYKIDNLLNRKLSYVPGYFSPGVTFRWGINWFLY
jgi:hypothetical protein